MPIKQCAVCLNEAKLWAAVDGYDYTDCSECGSIALDVHEMDRIDRGEMLRDYDASYWEAEHHSAKERAWSSSIARAAEAIYLANRPVSRFVDIGTGDGSLLDSLSQYLPAFSSRLFGVEMYPPSHHSQHPGYLRGSLENIAGRFDCGVCIEVIEHLTPKMLDKFVLDLSNKSNVDSLYIFNTGLSEFVRTEDCNYIDPVRRGHIVAYGWQALKTIFNRHGFCVSQIGVRNWAFVAEKMPSHDFDIHHRIWNPLTDNMNILKDKTRGAVLYLLARESLRVDC